MPNLSNVSTTELRFDLKISGYVFSLSSFSNALSGYNLKHFPGLVLPALPALYLALALLMGETKSDSTLSLGLYIFYLAKPGSITYTIPSMVRDVSAILVDTTHLRPGIPLLFLGGA